MDEVSPEARVKTVNKIKEMTTFLAQSSNETTVSDVEESARYSRLNSISYTLCIY